MKGMLDYIHKKALKETYNAIFELEVELSAFFQPFRFQSFTRCFKKLHLLHQVLLNVPYRLLKYIGRGNEHISRVDIEALVVV